MKLIFCPHCSDIRALSSLHEVRCDCTRSWGRYEEDGLNAVIGGDAVPLVIPNGKFAEALRYQDRPANYDANGKPLGKRFDVFVIPMPCDTVRREA